MHPADRQVYKIGKVKGCVCMCVCVLESAHMMGSACTCVYVRAEEFDGFPSLIASTKFPLPSLLTNAINQEDLLSSGLYFTGFPSLYVPPLHCFLGLITVHGSSPGRATLSVDSHPLLKKQVQCLFCPKASPIAAGG